MALQLRDVGDSHSLHLIIMRHCSIFRVQLMLKGGWDMGHGQISFRCGTCPCAYLYVWGGLYPFFLIKWIRPPTSHLTCDRLRMAKRGGFWEVTTPQPKMCAQPTRNSLRVMFIMIVFGFYICILRSLCLLSLLVSITLDFNWQNGWGWVPDVCLFSMVKFIDKG